MLLTLLDSLAQIDAEFLVSHERFGSNDSLIPKMADGRRGVPVLQMNELLVGRQEVAGLQVRLGRSGRRQLNLIQIKEMRLAIQLGNEIALIGLSGGRDERMLRNERAENRSSTL